VLLEVFRVHPSNFSKAAEIEKYNNENFSIHNLYQKKVMEVDLSLYIGQPKYKSVRDGWFSKAVNELFDPDRPDAPSIFIRRPLFLQLVAKGLIYVLD
jgi:hypothetical protein